MVNLNFIEQNASKKIVGQNNEEKIEYLQKLTHLYMHNNFIQKIVSTDFSNSEFSKILLSDLRWSRAQGHHIFVFCT